MPKNNATMEQLYESVELSKDAHFDFIGSGYEYYKTNNTAYRLGKEWRTKWYYWKRLLKKSIKFVLYN